jgi:hypothetical protein
MRLRFFFPLFSAAIAASLAAASDASACGGCVVPPEENTIVTGHRMALSISTKQTVLWDQIKYDGDPKSFGWLLPVKPGAVIEISTDAWFETLDATTSATVFAPPVSCPNSGGSGFGCAAADVGVRGSGEDFAGGNDVTVVHRGTVGPYQTVTLSTETPGALNDWLTTAGYKIDPATQPVVDAYVKEGFDFIALKLLPTSSVKEMKPVRVHQLGASPTLPLRMVAVGTGANVAVTLFLISEGRWEAENFENGQVPVDLLSWDFSNNSSNYATLREKVLGAAGGATWLTTFSQPKALLSPLTTLNFGGNRTYSSGDSSDFVDTIGGAYIQRGVQSDEASDEPLAVECTTSFPSVADSADMVIDPCPPGKPSNDPSCTSVSAGQIDARKLACGKLDDLAVALDGLHPKDVWLTRIEANLPRKALAQDLVVKPSSVQEPVDNEMQARKGENIEAVCGSSAAALPDLGKSNRGGGGGGAMVVAFGMAATALLGIARRRRARA